MILYCDTSALIKRYVEEDRSDEVDGLWEKSELNQIIAGLLLKHPLRGFDAIHLASALLMHKGGHLATRFACFDHALNRAAEEEGLDVPFAEHPADSKKPS